MAKKATGLPDLQEEALFWKQGSAFVFGVDEAGRGCLAGPVCAAVSCWAPFSPAFGLAVPVRDSKLMKETEREENFEPIRRYALSFGVGFASCQEIDRWNILRANYLAVARAVEMALESLAARAVVSREALDLAAFSFLTDGNHPLVSKARFFVCSPEYAHEFPLLCQLFRGDIKERCLVKGDSRVFSIASASVLAKVSRDRHMHALDARFPHYDFAVHKGYSTPGHVQKLRELGPCSEHRHSFAPVSEALALFP